MSFITIIRFAAALIVMSVLAITLIVAKRSFMPVAQAQEPQNKLEALLPVHHASEDALAALVEKLEVENLPDVTPGERAFEGARQLLEEGDYEGAEEKLNYVITYYPTAVSAPEARRILGEMNIDRLFSGKGSTPITKYKVRPGDSYYKIVRDHQTNLDLLVFLNNLSRLDRLHPGDTYAILPLNFRLVIDLPRKSISLWDGSQMIKSYELRKSTLPRGKSIIRTNVAAVEAQYKGRRVTISDENYRFAQKLIALKNPQTEIRSVEEKLDKDYSALYLDAADVEELSLLLRQGNSVEIRY